MREPMTVEQFKTIAAKLGFDTTKPIEPPEELSNELITFALPYETSDLTPLTSKLENEKYIAYAIRWDFVPSKKNVDHLISIDYDPEDDSVRISLLKID